MKKLMIATAVAAIAGGAFSAPLVYEYKASVKHMYEKIQTVGIGAGAANYYVKYVKNSKLQGYFIQDKDAASLLANTDAGGTAVQSEKKGFLVLINKSAEKNYTAPKIMPAQLDVKTVVTKVDRFGAPAQSIAEAYFYAGPFIAFPDAANPWDGSQDDGAEYMVNNGAANGAAGVRAYGTVGSTLYLFGQHNTYNRFDNTLAQPATICAFGDAWLNGGGFGTIGTAVAGLCCGWETSAGGSSVKSLSGDLKGGLFLCSAGGVLASGGGWFFALGLEDLYRSDIPGTGYNHAIYGWNAGAAEDTEDRVTWADGDISLSTTDVVSGNWTLKPAGKKFQAVALTAAETAWAGFATILATPNGVTLMQNIKAANQLLDKNYSLTTDTEPSAAAGNPTTGLISPNFAALYL